MDKKEILENYNDCCKRGLHPLKRIMSKSDGFVDMVVRWCPICGAIVIDTDCDGRVYPGKIMEMKLPGLTQIKKEED